MELLKNLNTNDLKFKKARKTATGSRIIDVLNTDMYQTPWFKIVYEPEYSICVEADNISEMLKEIDEKIVMYSSTSLDFSEEEVRQIYRPLLKNGNFSVSISSNTVLFDKYKNFYGKAEIKNVLRVGQYVRFIIKFKKIYFKDHVITFPLELIQIESA